MKILTIEHS